jgi:hypothetical protein
MGTSFVVVYDNPEGFGCTLSRSLFEQFLKEKCPTLFDDGKNSNVGIRRAVTGLSLWKTSGKMADWECLGRLTWDGCGLWTLERI